MGRQKEGPPYRRAPECTEDKERPEPLRESVGKGGCPVPRLWDSPQRISLCSGLTINLSMRIIRNMLHRLFTQMRLCAGGFFDNIP